MYGLRCNKFMEEDKKLLERGGFVRREKSNDLLPGLAIAHVELLLNPGLKFRKLLLLLSFRNTRLTTGKEVTCQKSTQVSQVGLSEVHSWSFFDIANQLIEVKHRTSWQFFRLKLSFSQLEVLSQILNGAMKSLDPFYSGNSLGVDVIEN